MSTPPSSPSANGTLVIASANEKGGTGKTTVTMNLAATASREYRTLVVDADPQGNAYDLSMSSLTPCGYDAVHELDPAVLAHLREAGYARIFVDCPGTLEYGRQVLDQVLAQADYVIIPYDHKPASREPTFRTAEHVAASGVPYRVLLNAIDWRYGADYILAAWAALDKRGIPSFRSFLREYAAWSNAQEEGGGGVVLNYRGGNAKRARDDLALVADELARDLRELVPA